MELSVVTTVIGVLASLLVPVLARTKVRTKSVKAHAELCGLGLALEMYADDHEAQLRWVVWSLGPQPDSSRNRSGKAPLAPASW